jgi:hypothetical protein
MNPIENITKIENQLKDAEKNLVKKNSEFEKLQNSKLKIFVFLTLLGPIFQYIPLRKGSLIENYGYPNGLIYYYIGCVIIIPIVYHITLDKMSQEIDQIERDIELLVRRKGISER